MTTTTRPRVRVAAKRPASDATAPGTASRSSSRTSGRATATTATTARPSSPRSRAAERPNSRALRSASWIIGSSVLIVLALLGLIALGVLPVRTYVAQKNELSAKQSRKVMLDERNLTLSKRVAALQTDAEITKLARLHYGLVPKGDTLTVIPGLRDESATLDATDGGAVGPVPAAVHSEPSSFVDTIRRLLVFWR